jgi:uncharacterized protein
VTVSSDSATQGKGASLTFRVTNERDDASTTAVEVDFPTDHPLSGVSVLSKPGWTFEVSQAEASAPTPSATPAPDEPAAQQVSAITWHISSAVSAIPPGGYDLFTVRVPKLPTDTDNLTFKAVQTYSSGEVVRWIDQAAAGAAEPEHPAPTLHLTAADATATSMPSMSTSMPPMTMPGGMTMTSTPMAGGMSMDMGPSRDDTVNVALGLGIAGLFVGLVAGTLGGAALSRSRSKSGN